MQDRKNHCHETLCRFKWGLGDSSYNDDIWHDRASKMSDGLRIFKIYEGNLSCTEIRRLLKFSEKRKQRLSN